MSPEVSVVITTRDHPSTLGAAIHSVLRQGVEVGVDVIGVGRMGDETARLVDALRDPRVRVLRAAGGVADARNAGWQQARGPVVAFLDDTDLWFGHKLRRQLQAMERDGSAWCYGSGLLFSDGGTLEALLPAPSASVASRELPYRNVVPGGGSNVIVTREALDAVGGFDPDVTELADWDLWIRLAQHVPPAVVESMVVASRHRARTTHREVSRLLAAALVIDERYRALRQGRSLDWADLRRWLCHDALRFGNRTIAIRLALASVRRHDPGRFDLAARSLLPVRRRPPVSSLEEVTRWIDRRFPPRVLSWPPGTEAELAALLARGADA